MKTYQNLILILLILVGIIVKSYSQSTSLNWTFFIDGKIPETVQCSMVLSQDNKKDTIRVDYVPGEMLISQGNYDKITNSSCENIVIDFSCYVYTCNSIVYCHYKIPLHRFLFNKLYVIFNIDNVSFRKGLYYLEIFGDGFKIVPPYSRRKSMYNVFLPPHNLQKYKHGCTDTIIMKKC